MYAFIHIPKTAGTTLRSQFRRSFGRHHCDIKVLSHLRASQPWINPEDIARTKLMYPKLAGICGHRLTCFNGLASAYPNIHYFTYLRDPLNRFVSHFNHFHRGNTDRCTIDDLAKYAADEQNQNLQTRWLCAEQNAQHAIENIENLVGMVGLTERYDESMLILNRWLDLPKFDLRYETRNRAPSKAQLPYFDDPDCCEIIEAANREDLRLYRHVVEERFPRQIEAYGNMLQADLLNLKNTNVDYKEPAEPLWSMCKRALLYKPALHFGR